MIRSTRIPPILDRICDESSITSALLVTTDGELLGSSSEAPPESLGTLLADIAMDYHRLGEEYMAIDPFSEKPKSHMQCLILEMDLGMIAVSACAGIDCLIIAIAKPDTPPGLLKARSQTLATYIQESLSTLIETT